MNPIKQAFAALLVSILCLTNVKATVEEGTITAVSDTVSSIATTTDISTGIAVIAGMCTLAAAVHCIYLAKEETQNIKETISKTIFAYCAGATGLIAVLCMTDPTVVAEVVENAAQAAHDTAVTVVENGADMINQAYEDTMNIVKNYCLL